MLRFSHIISFILFISLFGCKSGSSSNDSVIEFKVEPETSEYYGINPNHPIESMTAINTKDNDTLKLRLNEIEGFKYEKGYTWLLKVKKEKIENPPADASNIKYTLVKVISKTKK